MSRPFRYEWADFLAAADLPITSSHRLFLAVLGALSDEAGIISQPQRWLLRVTGVDPETARRWIRDAVNMGLMERLEAGRKGHVAAYRMIFREPPKPLSSTGANDPKGLSSTGANDPKGLSSTGANDPKGLSSTGANDPKGLSSTGANDPKPLSTTGPSSDLSLKKSLTSTGDEKNEVSDETIDLQAAGWISAVNAQLDPRHRMRATRTLLAAAAKCHDSSPTLFLDRVRAMHNLQAIRGAGPIAQSLLDWADDWVANRPPPPPPPCEHGVEAGVFCEPCLCEHGSLPARCPTCRRAGAVVLT